MHAVCVCVCAFVSNTHVKHVDIHVCIHVFIISSLPFWKRSFQMHWFALRLFLPIDFFVRSWFFSIGSSHKNKTSMSLSIDFWPEKLFSKSTCWFSVRSFLKLGSIVFHVHICLSLGSFFPPFPLICRCTSEQICIRGHSHWQSFPFSMLITISLCSFENPSIGGFNVNQVIYFTSVFDQAMNHGVFLPFLHMKYIPSLSSLQQTW